jgi:hypothetical protein
MREDVTPRHPLPSGPTPGQATKKNDENCFRVEVMDRMDCMDPTFKSTWSTQSIDLTMLI